MDISPAQVRQDQPFSSPAKRYYDYTHMDPWMLQKSWPKDALHYIGSKQLRRYDAPPSSSVYRNALVYSGLGSHILSDFVLLLRRSYLLGLLYQMWLNRSFRPWQQWWELLREALIWRRHRNALIFSNTARALHSKIGMACKVWHHLRTYISLEWAAILN